MTIKPPTPTPPTDPPRFASGVTAIYGLSGAGKSSLADTGAEYVAERFSGRTLCVAIDPGGWGNRRLSLIRAGVMSVYDPRNHVNFFETMDDLTRGAWPEEILDPDRGYADPNVRLVFPRQVVYEVRCPQGHAVERVYEHDRATIGAFSAPCPTCQILVTTQNLQVEQQIIRPGVFHKVGLRIFDSLTAMNDQGLAIELPYMSAAGQLPTSTSGGSALGSADAIRQGRAVYGTGSKAQVGFMQNRTYGWLVNIRAIPDQVLGAICTFGVEQSGGDDTRGGGEICYGLAIAGTARTARAGGWVGNLLHATKEPDEEGHPRHRLWLTNHIDPRDALRRPYLAKHRGTPLGMPDYLEDPWSDDPAERARLAWTGCSLKRFFELLEAQFAEVQQADLARFGQFRETTAEDEVISRGPTAAPATPAVGVGGGTGRTLGGGLRRPGAAVPAQPAPVPGTSAQPPTASVSAQSVTPTTTRLGAGSSGGGLRRPGGAAASPVRDQLEASLAAQGASPATDGAEASAQSAPAVDVLAPTRAPSTVAAPPPPTPGRLRRVARPPTE